MPIYKNSVACYDEEGRLIGTWPSTLAADMENKG